MTGHYLINLNTDEFNDKIANFDTLSLEQRLRLLVDRIFLARTDLVASDSLIDLLRKFEDETNPWVWEMIAGVIAHLKLFFTPDTDEEKRFKDYVLELITPQLKRLGIKPLNDANETHLQRIILALDFYASDEKTLKKLAEKYTDNLAEISPEIRSAILKAKLRTDEKIFDTFLKKYQKVADPEVKNELLGAMTLTRDAANIEKLISLLEKPDIVKPQDHVRLFVCARRNPKASAAAFDWMTNHWDYIEKIAGEKTLEDYLRYTANTVQTQEESDKFFAFFEPLKEHPILKRAYTVAETEIAARIKLIETDKAGVYQKLAA